MTTLYLSNDPTTGLDATSALPSGFVQGTGTWGVSTNNLLNGHSKSLQCTSALDGQYAIFAGATATTDMDFFYVQKNYGASPAGTALGAIVRSDSTFTNGYMALLVMSSNTAGSIYWFKKVAGTITGLAGTQAFTVGANTALNFRVQMIGTTLRAKVWPVGTSEPAAFTGSITDSSITTGSYAGFYNQDSATPGTINAATDIVVSNGFANSVTVDQPSTQTASASFTLTGTYQGTAPTAMDYIFNVGTFGTATAMTSFTASGGTWSGTVTAPATTGETFVTVQDHNNTTHTASSPAFTVNAAQNITINTPSSQQTSVAFTISGTYTGTAPTSLNYQVDSGGYTALTGATIAGGNWSGSITISSAGSHTVSVQENPATGVTATSGSFSVNSASIAITTPSGLLIDGQTMTISGTYTGTIPTGLNYKVDAGGYTAISSPTIAGGNWSGSITVPAFGQHTITVQEANATSVTATTGSFIASVAPNNLAIIYSPYNWNVTGASAISINAGAYFSTMFSGTSCTLNFDVSAMVTPASQIWWKCDNGPWTQATLSGSTVAITIPTASTSNADIPYHWLEVFIKSTTETGNRWNTGVNSTQVRFTGLTLAASAAVLATQKAPYNILIYGDSITEGVRTLGESATNDTDRNDSGVCWSLQLSELLGAEVGVVGFGATALVANTGSGNVPTLPNSYNLLYQGVSRTFSPVPDLVVTNIGQNDGVTNTVATMTALLNSLLTACPTSKIAVLRPFSGNQAANLQSAIAACSSPFRVTYVDTTGFFNTAYGSDSLNVHPSGPNSLSVIAPQVAGLLKPILQNTSAIYRGGFVRTA